MVLINIAWLVWSLDTFCLRFACSYLLKELIKLNVPITANLSSTSLLSQIKGWAVAFSILQKGLCSEFIFLINKTRREAS